MIYHRSCIDIRFEKHKYLDIITWVSIYMHHTSSTIVSSDGVNLQKPLLGISHIDGHLHSYERPIYPLSPVSYWPPSPVSYWPTKPSFVLAHQAQFCTGPPSPVSYWPPSPIPYWPIKLSFVLAHQAQFCLAHQVQFRLAQQAQFRTGPPSPISYWPNKPSSVLVHQAQIRIGLQS